VVCAAPPVVVAGVVPGGCKIYDAADAVEIPLMLMVFSCSTEAGNRSAQFLTNT
jgi:hypothetical protein